MCTHVDAYPIERGQVVFATMAEATSCKVFTDVFGKRTPAYSASVRIANLYIWVLLFRKKSELHHSIGSLIEGAHPGPNR